MFILQQGSVGGKPVTINSYILSLFIVCTPPFHVKMQDK